MKEDIEKEFVPYNESLELKNLGFDKPCIAKHTVIPEDEINWFTIPEQGITDKTSFGSSKNYNSKSFEEEGTISAPTFSQAFRWIREKHNLHAEPYSIDMGAIEFSFQIRDLYSEEYIYDNFKGAGSCYSGTFWTPEEAELECLRKLIEIVKNTK